MIFIGKIKTLMSTENNQLSSNILKTSLYKTNVMKLPRVILGQWRSGSAYASHALGPGFDPLLLHFFCVLLKIAEACPHLEFVLDILILRIPQAGYTARVRDFMILALCRFHSVIRRLLQVSVVILKIVVCPYRVLGH